MDWLPAAIRKPHPSSFPWQDSAPCKGVIHTTETSGRASYQGWTIMPHGEVLPLPGKGVEVVQFLPFSQGSFALAHPGGTAPTGGAHAFQFELVGTCDKSSPIKGAYYWPGADDAVLLDLFKKVVKPLSDAFHIPLVAPVFMAYPASYGNSAVRMGQQQWINFNGWAGHEHVASNDHGDPGLFPWDRMLRLVVPPKPPTPPSNDAIHGPLQLGSKGDDVSRLQHRLDQQQGVNITVDGDFGQATRVAVMDWQKRHGLPQDGIVGPATAKSLGFPYTAK